MTLVEVGGDDMEAELRTAAPYDTGATQAATIVEVAGLTATARAATEQAGFTNDGTRPHRIVPRNAKVLAFDVGGVTVFARYVDHPGTPATGWFDKVVARWVPFLAAAAAKTPF
ncbi:MAG TPA: hypothetical protein VGB14_16310 [Acidimicrobiales bacterium]